MAKKKGPNSRSQPDYFSLKAKKEGYPARSVYKLEEIQQKFTIIRPGNSVLDIGAAPGSWTLFTHQKLLKGKGRIVSVDLKPLSLNPIPENVTVFTGDAFTSEMLKNLGDLGPYDAIISDAAPSTTGARTVDCIRSQNLAEAIISIVPTHLKTGGNLVIKIFQGGGEQEILFAMKKMFAKVKTFKPKACRNDSFELFLIGNIKNDTIKE
ncbi:MAG: RlmE family RNA methyltransferase [Spirochaetes bacterium]|nr:RlmE family RNA methyltransferase [Spirochaetota bacterium]MBL7006200.1 RlmE family RNA methyltransferase [Spirochaetia bacterium]